MSLLIRPAIGHRIGRLLLVASLIAGSTGFAALADDLGSAATVELMGEIEASDDVSAIAKVGEFLVIGADEAVGPKKNENVIQVLKPDGAGGYEVQDTITIFEGPKGDKKKDKKKKEMDIEGIAALGNVVYVIGSHSQKRKKAKDDKSYDKNRKAFHGEKIEAVFSRGQIYKLELAAGSLVPGSLTEPTQLTDVIAGHEVLQPFSALPSKENGVDIEGLAFHEDWLYAGFRGPVLRGGYVPVMKFKFDRPGEDNELFYLNLGGRGIRSLDKVKKGFLVLAGPVGDEPVSFRLYHWDGKDMIPGTVSEEDPTPVDVGRATLLRELHIPAEAKAEGLAVLEETTDLYDLIVVFDGIEGPLALRYRIAKL